MKNIVRLYLEAEIHPFPCVRERAAGLLRNCRKNLCRAKLGLITALIMGHGPYSFIS